MLDWFRTVTLRAGPRTDAGQNRWHGSRHQQASS